jgi:hypothetical protein
MFSVCSNRQVIMSDRYEYARSGREKSVLLIFPEGTFEGLPFEVRLAAPWTGHGFGDIAALKPVDRHHFYSRGYAILREASMADVAAGDAQQDAAIPFIMRRAA